MKVYSISKWTFFGICALILTLPLSRHWRLLILGEKATGTVGEYTITVRESLAGEKKILHVSEIQFQVNDTTYMAYGPPDLEYEAGRTVNIKYHPGRPSEHCVLTFSSLYLNNYMILPLILLTLWAAFFLSFNSYANKRRISKKRNLFSRLFKSGKKARNGKTGETVNEVLRSLRRASKLLLLTLLVGMQASLAYGKHTEVDPSSGTAAIHRILHKAQPGDTILFLPGTYTGPFVLDRVHGAENLPVVLRGIHSGPGKEAVIDGRTEPGMNLQHHAFLLRNSSWITLEGFAIRNCWTDLIRADNSSFLSIRQCKLSGGKRALFATGRGSHHLLMELCSWEQDVRVWTHSGDYSWDEIHHGIHRHYNGSFFQGSGISGVIVLRDNEIRNTFNAFRLSQINDGAMDPLACSNVEIYRNRIRNTSDNVLEPEVHALNLHYYHNQMINGHAFISITEVAGGDIYIYGNTAVSLPDSDDGWTIFKISSDETRLTRPLYIFNNSWQVDFDVIGSPRHVWKNDHIRHFNNACVSEASDTFGIYHLGADNQFDYDCSNVPFPALLTSAGMESNGMVADPLFRDPGRSDFRLQENSPCIDRGSNAYGFIREYQGEAPDIGAYEYDRLVAGPPFRYMEPDAEVPYQASPRIVNYKLEDHKLTLWFSLPMDASTFDSSQLKLEAQSEDGYRLEFHVEEAFFPASGSLRFSTWPSGRKGQKLSTWASALSLTLEKTNHK